MLGAGGGVLQEGFEGFGEGVGVEVTLEELGDDAPAGDEVWHGDGEKWVSAGGEGGRGCRPDFGGVVDEVFRQGEGKGGDFVDDDEGVADESGLDSGGAGGDDGRAGVVEGFASVGDKVNVGELEGGIGSGIVGDPAGGEGGQAGAVDGGGYGEDVFDVPGVATGHFDHGGEVGLDLAPAGAREKGDPGFGGVEVVVGGVGFAGDGGEGEGGEGVAHEFGGDLPVAVEGGFEGEDDEHL